MRGLLEQEAKRIAPASEPAFDGAKICLEDFCDLLVGEAFDFAKDDDGAEDFRQLAQGIFNADAELCLKCMLVGALAVVGEQGGERGSVVLVGEGGTVDRDFLAFVPAPPAALVGGLVEGDAVEPGAQRGSAGEGADGAEDLEEDVLGDVGGVGRVVEAAGDEGVERLVVVGDEQGEGVFGAGFELGHEGGVFRSEADRTCQIAHCCSRLHSGALYSRWLCEALATCE